MADSSSFSTCSHSDSIPVIDFSLLISSDPDQRSIVLHDLAKACQDWSLFILVNHGIPETLLKAVLDSSLEFFEQPEEEKRQYETRSVMEPIKTGSGYPLHLDTANKVRLWRDFLKAYVHPDFHCPQKPHSLRDILHEYAEKTRSVFGKVLEAIGENLGLEKGFINEALKLEDCYQLYVANHYPPCPPPDQAIGIIPHTDYGLLTFLIDNGVPGLHIEHKGEWIETICPQNSVIVNIGDHLKVLSNGRYKSLHHKVMVNTVKKRISVALVNGPAPHVVVAPSPQLVERDGRPFYRSMKFIEYVETLNSGIGDPYKILLKIGQDG